MGILKAITNLLRSRTEKETQREKPQKKAQREATVVVTPLDRLPGFRSVSLSDSSLVFSEGKKNSPVRTRRRLARTSEVILLPKKSGPTIPTSRKVGFKPRTHYQKKHFSNKGPVEEPEEDDWF